MSQNVNFAFKKKRDEKISNELLDYTNTTRRIKGHRDELIAASTKKTTKSRWAPVR